MVISYLYNIYDYINILLNKLIKRNTVINQQENNQIQNNTELIHEVIVEQKVDATLLLNELKELKEIQEMNLLIISDMIMKSDDFNYYLGLVNE
jgi:hypothetical protein